MADFLYECKYPECWVFLFEINSYSLSVAEKLLILILSINIYSPLAALKQL